MNNPLKYTDPSGYISIAAAMSPYDSDPETGRPMGMSSGASGGWASAFGSNELGITGSSIYYDEYTGTYRNRRTGKTVSFSEAIKSYEIYTFSIKYLVFSGTRDNPYMHLNDIVFSTDVKNVAQGGGDWLKNIGTAASMFSDWVTGSGPEKRVFANDAATRAMSNAHRVNKAREFFYNKYKGQTDLDGAYVVNYKGSFGLLGLLRAGADPIEQYVGSCTINILCDGQDLYFVLKNNTSFESFFYGLGPDWNRSTFRPGGNMYQYYIWSEPLNPNKLK